VDVDGRVVVDASVCVSFVVAFEGLTSAEARVPRCVKTTADGAFVIDGLRPGAPFHLGATATDYAPAQYAGVLRLMPRESAAAADLVLARGGVKMHGRVHDRLGGFVAGATVIIEAERSAAASLAFVAASASAAASDDDAAPIYATTDARGEFIASVAPGAFTVTAFAAGYAEGRAFGDAPDHEFDISLFADAAIAGRAIERPGGSPVAGALVEAIGLDGSVRLSARSDRDGTFRITGLPPGRYHVEGLANGWSGYARAAVSIDVGETAADTIVELDRSPALNARVVEEGTHAPCAAGQVSLKNAPLREHAAATIQSDGTVNFPGVLPGTYEINVRCAGHPSRDDYAKLVVGKQTMTGVVWEVARAKPGTASGVVVDADGKPAANALVTASRTGAKPPSESDTDTDEAAAQTDARGAFVLRGLSPGAAYEVVASRADSLDVRTRITAPSSTELRLELGRGTRLSGVVVDEDGHPVESVAIRVQGGGGIYRHVETRRDGSFVALGVERGDYDVHAHIGGTPVRFMIGPGEPRMTTRATAGTEARLVIERRVGVIEGRVVESRTGEALADHLIEWRRTSAPAGGERIGWSGFTRRISTISSGPGSSVVTDASGHFRIEGLGAGDYALLAFRAGGAEGSIEHVTPGTSNVTIAVAEAGSITGTVTAGGNVKPDRLVVRVEGEGTHLIRTETTFHAAGTFTMRGLPPGNYAVSITAPEGVATTKVRVSSNATSTTTATLAAAPQD